MSRRKFQRRRTQKATSAGWIPEVDREAFRALLRARWRECLVVAVEAAGGVV